MADSVGGSARVSQGPTRDSVDSHAPRKPWRKSLFSWLYLPVHGADESLNRTGHRVTVTEGQDPSLSFAATEPVNLLVSVGHSSGVST
jgi:hypothetical protein